MNNDYPSPRTLIAASLVAAAGCATAPTGYGALAQRLVGKWSYVLGSSSRLEQTMELDADGGMLVTGVRHDRHGSSGFAYRGRWRVEDG